MLSLWALPEANQYASSSSPKVAPSAGRLLYGSSATRVTASYNLGLPPKWAVLLVTTELFPLHDYLQAEDGHVRAEAFVVLVITPDGVQDQGASVGPNSEMNAY